MLPLFLFLFFFPLFIFLFFFVSAVPFLLVFRLSFDFDSDRIFSKVFGVFPPVLSERIAPVEEAEGVLSNVRQAPHRSMQDACLPIMEALISDELFRYSDMHVKLYVASCITELTRITASVPPYNDEWMKDFISHLLVEQEIFQLTVAAFEKPSCASSPFFIERQFPFFILLQRVLLRDLASLFWVRKYSSSNFRVLLRDLASLFWVRLNGRRRSNST